MTLDEFINQYESRTHNIFCLCGSKRRISIRPRERFGVPVKFAICMKCGHTYASNPMRESELDSFYSSPLYRNLYSSGFSVDDHINKLNVSSQTKTALWNISEKFLPISGGSVLEWGCGGGWNLLPFRDFGHKVIGVDVNEPYLEAGRRILKLDLRAIDAKTQKELELLNFDVIILNHVLEHLLNPEELLQNLRSLCKPSTKLIIGLPTLERIKEYGFDRYFTLAHIHYFSAISFSSLVARCGYIVESTHQTHGGLTFVVGLDLPTKSRIQRFGFLNSMYLATQAYIEFNMRKIVKRVLDKVGLLERIQRRN